MILPRNPTPFWQQRDAAFHRIALELPHHLYRGIDNHAAGRTASQLVRKMLRGRGRVLPLMAT